MNVSVTRGKSKQFMPLNNDFINKMKSCSYDECINLGKIILFNRIMCLSKDINPVGLLSLINDIITCDNIVNYNNLSGRGFNSKSIDYLSNMLYVYIISASSEFNKDTLYNDIVTAISELGELVTR